MPRGSRVETWSAAGSGSRNRRGSARERRIGAATHLRDALGVGFSARRGPVRHRSGGHARGVLLVVPPKRTVMRSHRPRARVRAGRNHPRRARGRQTRGLTGRARCEVTRFAAAATRRRAMCACGRDRGAGDRAVAETGVRKRPETDFPVKSFCRFVTLKKHVLKSASETPAGFLCKRASSISLWISKGRVARLARIGTGRTATPAGHRAASHVAWLARCSRGVSPLRRSRVSRSRSPRSRV